jgi:hypothetical protein
VRHLFIGGHILRDGNSGARKSHAMKVCRTSIVCRTDEMAPVLVRRCKISALICLS